MTLFLFRLAAKNVPMAIATSSAREAMMKKLESHPIVTKHMKVLVAGDDPEIV